MELSMCIQFVVLLCGFLKMAYLVTLWNPMWLFKIRLGQFFSRMTLKDFLQPLTHGYIWKNAYGYFKRDTWSNVTWITRSEDQQRSQKRIKWKTSAVKPHCEVHTTYYKMCINQLLILVQRKANDVVHTSTICALQGRFRTFKYMFVCFFSTGAWHL